MWRSEKRLEFWLADGKPSPKPAHLAWLRKLRLVPLATVVQEMSLAIKSRAIRFDDAFSINANVQDGFEMLSGPADCGGSSERSGQFLAAITITTHCVDLFRGANVRRIPMPDSQRTRIRQQRLIMSASVQSLAVNVGSDRVQSYELIQECQRGGLDAAVGLFLRDPVILSTMQISELPHRLESIAVGELSDLEQKSYLHEAEVLKRIPADRAELLAVFRHVPIEMISRLRFLDENREIRYIISSLPKRTQTRVHDMAVIRDTANQEIHMVPHRTKSRTVLLT
jgi:hypothetical protein